MICTFSFSFTYSKDVQTIVSIWKYEQLNPNDYLSKKIYILHLNSDGTYIQYIQLIPNEQSQFKNVSLFTLTGKWYMKQNKLILVEYNKKNEIDMNYMYSNFENIDNKIILNK